MLEDRTVTQRRLRRKPSASNLEAQVIPKDTSAPLRASSVAHKSVTGSLDRTDPAETSTRYHSVYEIPERSSNEDIPQNSRTATSSYTNPSFDQRPVHRASDTIVHTIQHLELLLDEAIKLAQTAAKIENKTDRAQDSPEFVRKGEKDSSNVTPLVPEPVAQQNQSVLRDEEVANSRGRKVVTFPIHLEPKSTPQEIYSSYSDQRHGDKIQSASTALPLPHSGTRAAYQPPRGQSIYPSPRQSLVPQVRSKSSSNRSKRPDQSTVEFLIKPRTSSLHSSHEFNPLKTETEQIPMLRLNGHDLSEELETKDEIKSPRLSHASHFNHMFGINSRHESMRLAHPEYSRDLDLKKHSQVDFSLDFDDIVFHETCNHASVARNWPRKRKRWSAVVACINTSCIGLILGIYSGEVPAIQFVIIDLDHSIILGNVVLYLGLMISTLLLWPLPVLHGRKPYSIVGLLTAMCLQVPQGISVITLRLPNRVVFKVMLLLSRGLSGLALGLCDINLMATLLDLFGASLQSRHPHQETVDLNDVRRHGGGMGVWLGVWSWCSIGPLGIGFMIGAFIVNHATVDWGFWTSQLILMTVLLINVSAPEVRRSAFRRTLVELVSPHGEFGRVARGEIKMHLQSEGPTWWGEEVAAGYRLVRMMLKQFGFVVLAIYTAWVYAQFVLILMLIGSLASSVYYLRPIQVGLCALSIAVGALLAIPFQKASWLSRARSHRPRTDSMTFQKSVVWSSHLVRRITFTIALPITAIAYTLTSSGSPMPIAVPCVMSGLVGFFSNMAIAECYGVVFETFDTSDLQPGMTGQPARRSVVQRYADQRTNFSCYPRIMAGVSIIQALKFGLAAAATGLTGRVTRSVGAKRATAIVAGILLGLTLLLTIVMMRWNTVQIIPTAVTRRDGSVWEPIILGRPSGTLRKISILEDGRLTRWSEIRRRNRLETALTGG